MLEEKDKLINPQTGREIHHKKFLEKKIEELLNDISTDLDNLSLELKAQKKKKKKYSNLRTKEEILNLLKKKVQYLRNKYDNIEIDEQEEENNKTELQKLENYLEQRKNNKYNYADREIYDEEKEKMNEWDDRIQKQDRGLDEVHKGVKNLKYELDMAEEGIDNIQKKMNQEIQKIREEYEPIIIQHKEGIKFLKQNPFLKNIKEFKHFESFRNRMKSNNNNDDFDSRSVSSNVHNLNKIKISFYRANDIEELNISANKYLFDRTGYYN